MHEIDRKTYSILKILSAAKEPVGSAELSVKLKDFGVELTERAVRYHLKLMDEEGLTSAKWKEGRTITQKGLEELDNALVSDKVGFVISKVESMSYQMGFDLARKKGDVILNLSFIPQTKFMESLETIKKVYQKGFSFGSKIAVIKRSEEIPDIELPAGKIAIGTLCSINLNGILLKHGIPVESKFGGVLQIEKNEPLRFTELVSYSGSTLDPLEIFIKSKMTNINGVLSSGSGKVMASFREIPAVSRRDAELVFKKSAEVGLGSAFVIGKPGQSLLGIPVGIGRMGVVVLGGLNPLAAVEEQGIETENKALTCLIAFEELKDIEEI
ncbi:MAG: NrpR regulatory domain-containing protein [Candidatus Margulisiibacteriota bacterium]|nr:DUF128 domain-containing protein [Candidatus Margulisiibacteriota bacterium]